jgi:hypothetical protein
MEEMRMQWNAMQCSAVHKRLQCRAVQQNAMQCSAVQCSAESLMFRVMMN